MNDKKLDYVEMTPEQARRRRQRNIAIALALAACVILFYVVTFIKGPGVIARDI